MARKYRLRVGMQWLDGGIPFVDATEDTGNVTFTEAAQGVVQLATNTELNVGVGQVSTPKALFVRCSTGDIRVSLYSTAAATTTQAFRLNDGGFVALGLGNQFAGFRLRNRNTGASSLSSTIEYWICG